MQPTKPKLRFDISGYYFIGLLVLVIAGFWPSYFVKFFDGTANFSFYFHFHAGMMMMWIFALILQPILIKKKKLALHRLIGRMTYFLFPLIVISAVLMIHLSHEHYIDEKDLDLTLFFQFKDFILFAMAYIIAIRYRHQVEIHARAMIATGIALIEPALARIFYNSLSGFKVFQNFFLFGNVMAILVIYLLLISLIIIERRQRRGRWVFPLVLGVFFMFNIPAIFQIHIGLEAFSRWFVALRLT